jgi:hypothetical protein
VAYGSKMLVCSGAATAFLIAAVVLVIVRQWAIAGACALVAVVWFVVLLRVAARGNAAERREAIAQSEKAVEAIGRAESGGWKPKR